jgi:hypothetical protein
MKRVTSTIFTIACGVLLHGAIHGAEVSAPASITQANVAQSSDEETRTLLVAQAEGGQTEKPAEEIQERAVPGRMAPGRAPGTAPAPGPPPLQMIPAVPAPVTGPSPVLVPGVFLLQTSGFDYVTAVGGGGRTIDVIHTDAKQAQSWEKFSVWVVDPLNGKYGIATINTRNFLTAVGGGGQTTNAIHTDATQIQSWETFRLVPQSVPGYYGAYAIQTFNSHYLTATGGGGHNTDPPAVHTDATQIGTWETFWMWIIGDLGSGSWYRISYDPTAPSWSWLYANGGGGRTTDAIRSTRNSSGWSDEQTRFKLWRQGDGTYAIQTVDGHYVTADQGGGLAHGSPSSANLQTNRTQVQAWEKFRFVDQGNGTYAIQTVSGYYLGFGPEDPTGISTAISDPTAAYKFRLSPFF